MQLYSNQIICWAKIWVYSTSVLESERWNSLDFDTCGI